MSTPRKVPTEKHAESSPAGWLGFFFGGSYRRRLVVAFAAAIALHEVVAGLMPQFFAKAAPPEPVTAVALLTIVRATPTPKPTPAPVVHTRVIADRSVKPHKIDPGASAHRQVIKKVGQSAPTVKTRNHSKPIWDIPVGGQGAGAGKKGTVGSVGHGGNGTGEGSHGSGIGSGASEPCGFVSFSDPHGSDYDRRTGGFFVDIDMSVSFPDHSTQDVLLNYPFYYPSEAANPFSDGNVRDHPDMEITFQFPPASKRASEPALVQYVIAHTNAQGYTKMRDCPGGGPPGP